MAINERVLQRILDQHAQEIRDCKCDIKTIADNAASDKQLKDIYEIIEVLQRRVDYCEALQGPINHLMNEIDQVKTRVPAAMKRRVVTVRACGKEVRVERV